MRTSRGGRFGGSRAKDGGTDLHVEYQWQHIRSQSCLQFLSHFVSLCSIGDSQFLRER